MRPLVPAFAAAAVFCFSSSVRAEEPETAAETESEFGLTGTVVKRGAGDGPTARHPPSSVRWKLISGGLFVVSAAYAAGFACARVWPEVPGSESLEIPVAGPWIALGKSGCAPDDPDCGAKLALRGVLYVLSGLAQLGGLGIIGEGIFATTEANPVRKKKAAMAHEPAKGFTITPIPVVSAHVNGLGFAGSF